MKNVMVKAREDHKAAVNERITEISQLKDIVEITKNLFTMSKVTNPLFLMVMSFIIYTD